MASQLPDFSEYIVFVDESGSPSLNAIDLEYPIFVLVFCVISKKIYSEEIQPAIKKLKFEFFGHDMTVLHSHEIRKPRGDFLILKNPEIREYFQQRLSEIIRSADFKIIAQIVDKRLHSASNLNVFDPYTVALRLNMARLNLHMKALGQKNKLLHIIAESRGRIEDRALMQQFQWIAQNHAAHHDGKFELRFAEKKINSAGLQLADLMGHPIGRKHIKPEQANRAFDALLPKLLNVEVFPRPA